MEFNMPFPDIERAVYKKNPLAQVICQLRFPVILSINENSPAAFQDEIRDKYPLYNKEIGQQQQISFELSVDGLFPSQRTVQSETWNTYVFSSEDYNWAINLTGTFLSLSANKYDNWDEFKDHLLKPLKTFTDIYKPAFYERIGLRYINVFRRSLLGLDNTSWDELFVAPSIGFLSDDNIKNDIFGYQSTSEVRMEQDINARIATSLGYVEDIYNQVNKIEPELSFIIDHDLYSGKKQCDEVGYTLEKLHDNATRLIRALIKKKLHEAMEPLKI